MPPVAPSPSPARDVASPFRFTRLVDDRKERTNSLSELMGGEDVASQSWLFLSPHDDDLSIGAGLLIQAAVRAGVDVRALIVTDGCLGYCREEHRDTIVAVRQQETYESFAVLGLPDEKITYIGYPDGGLMPYIGRRRARELERALCGHIGLQNAFTYYLRKFRPQRVFVPTYTDLHPDHRITHSELMISIFHASGKIWPELGPPLATVPQVGELAVYCDFAELPNIEVVGNDEVFQTKLSSIAAYRSQVQISSLVAGLRKAGPYEYIREHEFRLFSPDNYKPLFA